MLWTSVHGHSIRVAGSDFFAAISDKVGSIQIPIRLERLIWHQSQGPQLWKARQVNKLEQTWEWSICLWKCTLLKSLIAIFDFLVVLPLGKVRCEKKCSFQWVNSAWSQTRNSCPLSQQFHVSVVEVLLVLKCLVWILLVLMVMQHTEMISDKFSILHKEHPWGVLQSDADLFCIMLLDIHALWQYFNTSFCSWPEVSHFLDKAAPSGKISLLFCLSSAWMTITPASDFSSVFRCCSRGGIERKEIYPPWTSSL